MYRYLGNTEIFLYDVLNVVSGIILVVFNLLNYKKKAQLLGKVSLLFIDKLPKTQNKKKFSLNVLFVITEILIICVVQYLIGDSLNFELGSLLNTGANYYARLLSSPLFVSLTCILLGINIFKQMDLITPSYPLALTFSKLGCFCAGCCAGIPCDFGLYNHRSGLVEFPVQLVEAGLAFLIFVFLLCYRKKAKEGTMFPIYLIIYSGTRFFSEFLKDDPDILWKLKTYHLLCICGVIIGIVELFIVKKLKKPIEKFGNRYIDFVISCIKKVVLILKNGMCAFSLKVKSRIHKFAIKHGIIREKNIVHHKRKKK